MGHGYETFAGFGARIPQRNLTPTGSIVRLGNDQPPQPMVKSMTEPHKRVHRHPTYKTAYRVTNWPAYEQALRDRGDSTLRISQDAIDAWMAQQTGTRGVQPVYADIAIETVLLILAAAPNGRLSPVRLDADGRGSSLSGSYDTFTT